METKERKAIYRGAPVVVCGEPVYQQQGLYAGKFGIEIKMLVGDAKALGLDTHDYSKFAKFAIFDMYNLIYDDVEVPLPFE